MPVQAEIRRNATLVAAIAAGYFVLLLVVSVLDGSQAGPDLRWLPGAPAADHWLARIAVAAASAGATAVAFRTWVRPAGRVAWAGAGAFVVTWPVLRAGVAAHPALFVGLAAVAATGLTMRWLVERDRGALAGSAGGMAVTASLDPVAAAGLCAALVVVIAVWARLQGPPLAAALLGGGVLGLGVRAAVGLQTLPGWPGGPVVWPLVAAGVGLALWGIVGRQWPHRRNAAAISAGAAVGILAASGAWQTPAGLPAAAAGAAAAGAGILAVWEASRRVPSSLTTPALILTGCLAAVWQVALAAG